MESEELIGKEAISFFQQLFMVESDPSCSYGFLDAIPKLVTDLDNSKLMEPPAMDEVKETVFSMDGESARGRMGLQAGSSPLCGK